jgi:hypothetical protein
MKNYNFVYLLMYKPKMNHNNTHASMKTSSLVNIIYGYHIIWHIYCIKLLYFACAYFTMRLFISKEWLLDSKLINCRLIEQKCINNIILYSILTILVFYCLPLLQAQNH